MEQIGGQICWNAFIVTVVNVIRNRRTLQVLNATLDVHGRTANGLG